MSEKDTFEKEKFFISLKIIMTTKGINQKELSKLTGTEEALISRWMNGKTKPTYEKMKQIADALDCHIELVPKENDVYETAYFAGFEYGGQMMLKEIIKMLKGMRWYGGDKPEKRAD